MDKEDYLLAMERSPIRDIEIKHVLKKSLTKSIDRLIYMKGLDVSYHIEGYNAYKAEELWECGVRLYHYGDTNL